MAARLFSKLKSKIRGIVGPKDNEESGKSKAAGKAAAPRSAKEAPAAGDKPRRREDAEKKASPRKRGEGSSHNRRSEQGERGREGARRNSRESDRGRGGRDDRKGRDDRDDRKGRGDRRDRAGGSVDPTRTRRVEPPPFDESWVVPPAERESEDEVCFQDLDINPRILKGLLEDLKFRACTPIQGMSLPHTLAGKDLAGRAQTGTGKTAAFLVSILHRLLDRNPERKANQPFALMLAPTRELAVQIITDAAALCKHCGVRTVAVYGGMSYDQQLNEIAQGVDLVAATPGRLIDYLRQGAIDLSRTEVLVIDEADRMLDMGFIPDVRRIVSRLPEPKDRQTMLFSATLSGEILKLSGKWMRENPVKVETDPEQLVAEGVHEIIYAVSASEKLALLLWTLNNEEWTRVLIFRNRRRDVENLYYKLKRYGVKCEMLSGDVPQKRRMRILEEFRSGEMPVVVATDVAGRGIHVEGISHVVNYDFPFDAEDYVHRIGRTGRAGEIGRAISFAGDDCAFVIPEIEAYIDRELPVQVPEDEMVHLPEPPPRKPGERHDDVPPNRRRSSSGDNRGRGGGGHRGSDRRRSGGGGGGQRRR